MNNPDEKKSVSKTEEQTGHKVTTVSYRDLSDYARPVAIWIAKRLQHKKIHVYQITIFHFLLMLLAVLHVAKGGMVATLLACLFILVKNILDAVDGSLARLRNRPSRVGRFLDSDLDFVGNLLLFLVFYDIPLWLRCLSFLSFIIQGTFFNYYYILFRKENKGDITSKVEEDATSIYDYDNQTVLSVLYFFYTIFYQWQDGIAVRIDRMIKNKKRTIAPSFISAMSIHGLGFQYLVIIVFMLLNQQKLIAVWFVVIMNVYLVAKLFILNHSSRDPG